MASEVDYRPQEPDTGPAATKAANDGATQPSPPTTNGKSASTTKTITNSEGGDNTTAPSTPTTNLLVPIFPDNTSSHCASASEASADADAGADSDSTTSREISPITSPPYWQLSHANGSRPNSNSHNRTPSAESVLPPGAITLQDNEDVYSDVGTRGDVSGRDRNRACWAKSVEVVNHVVVNGSATNIGAFVVWNIRVETLSVSINSSLRSRGRQEWRLMLT